jgi:hypothetical protein
VSSKGNSRENGVAYWCSREESVVLAGFMASVWEEGEGAGRKWIHECPEERETIGRIV